MLALVVGEVKMEVVKRWLNLAANRILKREHDDGRVLCFSKKFSDYYI
jgi:hypothetical protein